MTIKSQCKNCGCEAPADQFKLHYGLKMMVCPSCYSGKKIESIKNAPKQPEEEIITQKEPPKATFKKIPGSSIVQCNCQKCKYSFKYDPFRKFPKRCPYCDNPIPRLKTFTLL